MDNLIDWVRGPLFRATFVFMILGLARLFLLGVWDLARAWYRAGDRNIPFRAVLRSGFSWLVPGGRPGRRHLTGIISLVFHVAILTVPVFLAGHVLLWKRSLGISWPAFPDLLSDILTVLAVLGAVAIVLLRVTARDTRHLGRPPDYVLPILVALPFLSGWFLMHPAFSPFPYQITMLFHLLSAETVFVLLPLTKLSHAVLLPETPMISELAWHWPADAGSRVAVALGKENDPV